MTIFYLDEVFKEAHTAATKAPDDINEIMKKEGFKRLLLGTNKPINNVFVRKIYVLLSYLKIILYVLCFFNKNDVLIANFPFVTKVKMKRFLLAWCKLRGVKLIFIIHDLDSLRKSVEMESTQEVFIPLSKGESLVRKADKIICHNYKMKEYLEKQGVIKENIIELEIFDYLLEQNINIPNRAFSENLSVTVAGNLIESKAGYIYQYLKTKKNVKLNLFGPNFDQCKDYNNYNYFGSLPPNTLPNKLIGHFGLVWDGDSIFTCSGRTGKYLKYNNPHKTSLFLASELPIIIWKDAALAKFVKDNNLGITISSLHELDDILSNIDFKSYQEMYLNVKNISRKLRDGFFTKKAIYKCLEDLGEISNV